MSFNNFTFIGSLVDSLFVMGDHNGFFVVFLYVGMSVANVVLR